MSIDALFCPTIFLGQTKIGFFFFPVKVIGFTFSRFALSQRDSVSINLVSSEALVPLVSELSAVKDENERVGAGGEEN